MKVELSKELREVFEQLIPIYEKAVEELPNEYWLEYLEDNFLDNGICFASIMHLDIEIDLGRNLWHTSPAECETGKRAIDCLQWRINKMKELLNQNQ